MTALRVGIAAVAALLAIGACSSTSDGTTTTAAPPATTTLLPTTLLPTTLLPTTAPVVQGIEELDHFAPLESDARYSLDPDADPSTAMRVVYDIPADGWTRWDGAAKFDDEGHVAVTITTVLNLVRHGCLDHSRVDPPVGPSVDDLATALTELAPFLVTSPPKDVSIYGYEGKHLELTVPDLSPDRESDAPFTECLDSSLKSWVAPFDDEAPDAYYGYTGPGYVEEFWLLDVEGTRLMIAAQRSADSSPADIAEMREILESIRIEPGGFPTGVFAGLGEEPVSDELAAELQGLVDSWAEGEPGGLTATLITPVGMWSGAAGFAAGDRAMTPHDQMAIASVTKTVVAAQLMQLVEAGELRLDDLAADHLPADLEFGTNGATVADLLSMRSGIPDWVDPVFWESLSTDPLHAWSAEEVLALVGPERTPVGQEWNYSSTNYALLGLIVEHVTGRTFAEVLRDGALSGSGYERMIYQPDEQPSEPMAMPFGAAVQTFGAGGGYLPSLAGATSAGPAGAIAADSLTVARWWRALCAGKVVSAASFDEMTDFLDKPEYGLGIADMSETDGEGAVGHGGSHVGFKSWALCLPEPGIVVVALTNSERDSIHDLAAALARAASE